VRRTKRWFLGDDPIGKLRNIGRRINLEIDDPLNKFTFVLDFKGDRRRVKADVQLFQAVEHLVPHSKVTVDDSEIHQNFSTAGQNGRLFDWNSAQITSTIFALVANRGGW
jgi:hypothetical protein